MEAKKNPCKDIYKCRNLTFSFSLMLSLVMVISIFEWKSYPSDEFVNLAAMDDNFEDLIEIPPTHQPPPPPPKVIRQPEIIEVANEEEIKEEIAIDLDIEMDSTSEEVIELAIIEETPKEEVTDEIFTFVESQPQFKGGQSAFLQFVHNHMKYPSQAIRMGIEGRVFVKVIIEKDGAVSHAEVARGIGGGCNEEALRVIKLSPRWIPGKQRGKPVRVSMTFPITFRLEG